MLLACGEDLFNCVLWLLFAQGYNLMTFGILYSEHS